MVSILAILCATIAVCIASLVSVFKAVKFIRRPAQCDKLIAFFHPYCDSGGGGERVLWFMVFALLNDPNRKESIHIVIYSGDKKSKQQIVDNVKAKFNIILSPENVADITIVDIQSRFLLEAKYYPVATMVGQSLGSLIVGLECLLYICPDIYIDTIGAAFTYPLAKLLGGSKVIAYVHYPIISSDMLNKVRERRPDFNNNSLVSSSVTISNLKLVYYQLFAQCYSYVGSFASTVMVNSSWTHKHIAELWNFPYEKLSPKKASISKKNSNKLLLVYPPCNTSTLECIPLDRESHDQTHKKRVIVSIGQFRPEKHHILQIKALAKLIESNPSKYDDVLLVLIGSTRNKEDAQLQKALAREAADLGVYENVRFEVNQPYGVLVKYMAESLIGLHSMWNEHFGISIVEMMAAGLIVIAHNSGGPVMDIVISATAATDETVAAKDLPLTKNTTGFVARTVDQYAQCMSTILDGYDEQRSVYDSLRKRARLSTLRFSDEEFMRQCVHAIRSDWL